MDPDEALRPLLPVFLAYVLSFVNLGIYWNNHHHMMTVTDRVNGKILWSNMHLLFWCHCSRSWWDGWARTSSPRFPPPSTEPCR